MNEEKYLFTRKPYLIMASIALLVMSLAIVASYTSFIDILYKVLVAIFTILILIITIEVFLRHLVHYMFCIQNPLWIKEIDRPRLFFCMISVVFFSISLWGINKNGIANVICSFLLLLMAFSSLIFPWIKSVSDRVIKNIRKKLSFGNGIKCIINEEKHDMIQILNKMDDYLSATEEEFKSIIRFEGLHESESIQLKLDKAKAIRFVFILFDLNEETENKTIINLFNAYFKNSSGEKYSFKNRYSEISNIRSEIINKQDSFIKMKDNINNLINSCLKS